MAGPLTRDELLILLIEECAEIIQAATKCLRFGYDHDESGYGVNSEQLATEVDDALGVVDALALDQNIVTVFRTLKLRKAQQLKDRHGRG